MKRWNKNTIQVLNVCIYVNNMIDAQNPLRKGKPFTDIMLSKGRIQKIESAKELSLCNKSKFSNTYISTTKLCKPLIFQALIV